MISSSFEAVSVADILDLPERGATEARDLEFKRYLPERSNAGIKEFLADVSTIFAPICGI